jgi:cytochrome c oxidase cbb3-type subunit 2
MRRSHARAAALAALAAGAACATTPDAGRAARGRAAYDRYCTSCHGVRGDGAGPSAAFLDPAPRDFTSGTYKFRSTPSGTLPTDADLLRTLGTGLHGTFMPRWAALSELERKDLVQTVKSFSPRFGEEPQGPPIAIPPRPASSPALVQRGRETWDRMQCSKCHGEQGRGDVPSAAALVDDWGHPIRAYDFTAGPLKVGDAPEDLYRTFMTGLNGTPMPSYAEAMSPEDAWALVFYVRTLRRE